MEVLDKDWMPTQRNYDPRTVAVKHAHYDQIVKRWLGTRTNIPLEAAGTRATGNESLAIVC